jgi:hypothetical protein
LGGYLALRAASGEPRLAACIADPALFSIGAGIVGRMRAAGVSGSVIERYPNIDDDTLAPIAEAIHGDRTQRWAVEQRGFWVHGVSTLREYVAATFPFSVAGRLGAISCPTALTAAEDDPLARSADQVYDDLRVSEDPPALHGGGRGRRPLRDAQPQSARPTRLRLARRRPVNPSSLATAAPACALTTGASRA